MGVSFLLVNRLLAHTPVSLEQSYRLAELRRAESRFRWVDALARHHPTPESLPRAQLGQDLFVLNATSFEPGGFFVEFGAGDGLNLSNTVLLERSFGWTGIVVEPAKSSHEYLRRNRSCIIDTRCVWATSDERLDFAEAPEAEYSTLRDLIELDDGNRQRRSSAVHYEVTTVSLNDLLDQHSAPARIDYLSVDTEGSEYEILNAFDFARRQIGIITVEHGFDPVRRSRLHMLLSARGFERVLEDMSLWDDWYVSRAAGGMAPETRPGLQSS